MKDSAKAGVIGKQTQRPVAPEEMPDVSNLSQRHVRGRGQRRTQVFPLRLLVDAVSAS